MDIMNIARDMMCSVLIIVIVLEIIDRHRNHRNDNNTRADDKHSDN